MILLEKNHEEIMEETLKELVGMGITEDNPGGVARLFLNIINKKINEYYKVLKLNHVQAFVSTANDEFLDMIGALVNCERNSGEENDDYRYRITKQIQVVASGNRVALRLAALSVPGVQDVMMRRFTHGTGSYSMYVISEEPVTTDRLLDEVQDVIDDIQSFGVRGRVFRPIIQSVDMRVRLVFNKSVPDLERSLAIAQSEDALKYYVNTRNVGEPLLIEDINREIKNVHKGIEEVILFNYKINNRPMLPVDQECAWNERFVESDKPNAVQVI